VTVAGAVQGGPLAVTAAGLSFQNPVVLASGTAGYGRELDDVMDLNALGGLSTKAVSLEPRGGNKPLRVGMFDGGMINAIGLANPGLSAVRDQYLPWLAGHVSRARVLVNVVGYAIDEFAAVVEGLEGSDGIDGFELNVSCPNVKAGGLEFGMDPVALASVVQRARTKTRRPLFVKLSPAHPSIADAARVAIDAGADALTLVNTLPGLVIEPATRRPMIGFGTGGVSGAALLPIGVRATWLVRKALPTAVICGLGGVSCADDALQYVLAGATLVGVGTASMKDPRAPERIVRDLGRWCERQGVRQLADLVGTLEWPS
jgi:dihydroorotate dehydrogenase (NAD+) catalytic subunit